MSDVDQPDGPNAPVPEPAPISAETSDVAGQAGAESDLPEWEPLTPELVEDEAIRGDFVIRWAVVGLALLFGLSQIADSRTLVQIRTGEYLAAHGWLPPRQDVFSTTAADRPWVHLSWLWDLATAGVYGLGGGIALSLWQGMLTVLAVILLLHASRPEIRSWWGSVCAMLVLLAAYPQFTLQPELVTILGTCAVCWWLARWQERPEDLALWPLVTLLWLWAQLDPRVFLGWGLLIAYGIGAFIASSVRANGSAGLTRYWKAVGLGIVLAALHPQWWQVWTGPWQIYGLEYPAWRFVAAGREQGAWPLTSAVWWRQLNHQGAAALALLAATLISMLLNRVRVPAAHVTSFLFANATAVAAAHELAFASIVNCMICTWNAQSWYLARFGQVYSLRWNELLFSRGGRAVTVLVFFGIAWLVISGRIDGPDGRRTGLGFHAELQDQMDGYVAAAAAEYDDHPFHMAVRQGDLLIWAGRKSFVDSRLALFQDSDGGMLALHDRTRRALREAATPQGREAADYVREIFDRYQVTHVMPRLNQGPGALPDYVSFQNLLATGRWDLSFLGSSTAVFHQLKESPPEYAAFLKEHRFNPLQPAFKDVAADELAMDPRPWPVAPTAYQTLFSVPETHLPGPIQEASHYQQMAGLTGLPGRIRVASALIAIRGLQAGLRSAPNSATGYLRLAQTYLTLEQIEATILGEFNVPLAPNGLRYFQSVGALTQAATLRPDDPDVHGLLFQLYSRTNRSDLALREIRELKRLTPLSDNPTEDEILRREQLVEMEAKLTEAVEQLQGQVASRTSEIKDKLVAVSTLADEGLLASAIQELEADAILRSQNPIASLLYGSWLYEAGRLEDAEQVFEALEQTPGANQQSEWRVPAAMVALARGDYVRAGQFLRQELRSGDRLRLEGLLSTAPMSRASPMGPNQFPLLHAAAILDITQQYALQTSQISLNSGLVRLEQGDLAGARSDFQSALERAPATSARPLLRFYWYCLTDELLDLEPEHEQLPTGTDAFMPEPAAD